MGGVLVDFDPQKMMSKCIPPEYHSDVNKYCFESEIWKEMDKGTVEVEEAVEKMLLNLPECIHSSVRHMIIDREEMMPVLPHHTPIIKKLSENGYSLFVLSNCPKWFHEFKSVIPLIDRFEGFVVSADYFCRKPDEIIYNILFDTFCLKPEECFFIDDSYLNTRTAEKLGMKAFCYSKNPDELLSYMNECGINI